MADLSQVQAALSTLNAEVERKSQAVDNTITELKKNCAASPKDLEDIVNAVDAITLKVQAIPES